MMLLMMITLLVVNILSFMMTIMERKTTDVELVN